MNHSDHSIQSLVGKAVGKMIYPESPTKKRYPRSPQPEKSIISPSPDDDGGGASSTRIVYHPERKNCSPTKKRHSPRKPQQQQQRPFDNYQQFSSPSTNNNTKLHNNKQFFAGLPSIPLSPPGKKRFHHQSPPVRRAGRQTISSSSPYAALPKNIIVQRNLLRTLIVLIGILLTLIPFVLHAKVVLRQNSTAVLPSEDALPVGGRLRKAKQTRARSKAHGEAANRERKIPQKTTQHKGASNSKSRKDPDLQQRGTKTKDRADAHHSVNQQQQLVVTHNSSTIVHQSAEHIAKTHSILQAAVARRTKKSATEQALLGSDGDTVLQPLPRPGPVSKNQAARRPATPEPKFACAYILGGCDPANPSAYRGFLYNIVLSVFLQHQEGSKADTVVFVQMSNESGYDSLPESDLKMLYSQHNVHVEYIPTNPNESFDQLMFDKFRILSLTQYDRVIYMDSDVMARGSLDFIMKLSVDGVLKNNLVFAGSHVPATGALFMVAPAENDRGRIQQIIARGYDSQNRGWGHAFEGNDSYELSSGKKKRNWDFQGASTYEGLLYHWVKYEKQSVSIVLKDKVQNWGVHLNQVMLEDTLDLDVFAGHHYDCWFGDAGPCLAPHTSYYHFTGDTKPWLSDAPKSLANVSNPTSFWFHMLSIVNAKLSLGIDFDTWKPQHRPLLGLHSKTFDEEKAASGDSVARFAYAYVVGGCDSNKPAYRQFIYDILINTHLQREEGSEADVVAFFQMLNKSTYDTLPQEDLRLLNEMDIKVHYIPKSADESFDRIMMEKFRILGLTQYDRVLFMDSDVMVRGSFDYLFDLSVQGILKKNIVFAGRYVPASGDIFMIEPKEGHWDRALDIIRDKEERGNQLPFPHWDVNKGWGHTFGEGDYYELIGGSKGKTWDFRGVFSDQGFLYNWVKYEEQSVSIIMRDSIQNWDVGVNGMIRLEDTLELDIFDGLFVEHECWKIHLGHKPCKAPHSGYVHFSGGKKPWLQMPPENFISREDASNSAEQFWYHTLSVLNTKLRIGLDFEHWNKDERPLLGMYSNDTDAIDLSLEVENDKIVSSKFAYAYVVGGCDPSEPAYRNFINAILVNTQLMREEGSEADVVILFQMSFNSPSIWLPDDDLRILNTMNIKVRSIPKTEHESFERLMLDKFRVLGLTQYERVIYMDSDVMVRGSMDYLFHLSAEGVIKENLVISGRVEPAIGTIFMVAPKEGDWDRILEVIRKKEERGEWDEVMGWGHPFQGDDDYEMINGKKNNKWDFGGASGDQGLLYHWVKFVKKSLTIVMKNTVQNWGVGEDGNVRREKTFDINEFTSFAGTRECWEGTLAHKPCTAPHSDWIHFPGLTKPWLHGPPEDLSPETAASSPAHFWFKTLSTLNKKLHLGLKFNRWKKHHHPLLGVFGTGRLEGPAYSQTATELFITSPYSRTLNSTISHQFAYVYVIGGCKPEDPAYRNYIYDIMISTYVQREEGSQADVIVFVQIAYDSEYETLPDEDLRLLDAMDIKIQYIPKAQDETFYSIMLDKFRILGLTQYKRVLFMDGDILARGSLDYLFNLSIQGVFKENVVMAGHTEPANGGFFMVAPKEGSWDRIMEIITRKEERCAKLPYPHWDEEIGWSHPFEDGDYYELNRGTGKKYNKWDFHGAFADQGLLYHWVKYEKKSVSIIFRDIIQNWGVGPDGKVHLEKELDHNVFDGITKSRKCFKRFMVFKPCTPPYSDNIHFTGKFKPWLIGPPENFGEVSEETSAHHYWFHILSILDEKLQIGLDFKNWKTHHRPLLGMYPQFKDAAMTKYASRKFETE